MRRLSHSRRGFSMVELVITIGVLLVLGAIAVPLYLGQKSAAEDASTKAKVMNAYKVAKAEWASSSNAYPLNTPLLAKLNATEPGLDLQAAPLDENTPVGPVFVDTEMVDLAGRQVLTVCSRSKAGRFYCLRSDETGELMLAALEGSSRPLTVEAASSGQLARSMGNTFEGAVCALPTRETAPMTNCPNGSLVSDNWGDGVGQVAGPSDAEDPGDPDPPAPPPPAPYELVSGGLLGSGAAGNAASNAMAPTVSRNGRFVVFGSYASNLVPGDTNNQPDVFIYDRVAKTTERVSERPDGTTPNPIGGPQSSGFASDDGRYVVFSVATPGLDPSRTCQSGLYRRDRVADQTVCLLNGPTNWVWAHGISADGRYVLARSQQALEVADANWVWDAYRIDVQTGTILRATKQENGQSTFSDSYSSFFSADGRYVGYLTNGRSFLADLNGGTAVNRQIRAPGGSELYPQGDMRISGSGRYVSVMNSGALVAGDTNSRTDVYRLDLDSDEDGIYGEASNVTATRASMRADGGQGTNNVQDAIISGNARHIFWRAQGADWVAAPVGSGLATYVRDLQTNETLLVADAPSGFAPSSVSDDGRIVVGLSNSAIIGGDTNGQSDVFIRNLDAP